MCRNITAFSVFLPELQSARFIAAEPIFPEPVRPKLILTYMYVSIPSHFPRIHFLVCSVAPLHSLPPPDEGGLVQERVRVRCPLPQVTLQAEYSDH